MFTATLTIDGGEFALAHSLGVVPEMRVQADRLAGHSRHWVMPCLWTAGGAFADFDAALEDDPTVNRVVTATEYDDEKFYQIDWSEDIKAHMDTAIDREGSLLDAQAVDGEWRLTIRFSTREQFAEFRAYLDEQGIAFSLETLTRARTPQQFMGGLTAAQRDALVVAVQEGYFAIPREATMEDVASALGISTQAASERIRRGTEQFVETMLVASAHQLDE